MNWQSFSLFGLLAAHAAIAPACRNRSGGDEPAAGAPATSSTTTKALAMEALPPRYRLFHTFQKDTGVWGVGSRLIACESCFRFDRTGGKPRTWLVSPQGVEEDASLVPRLRSGAHVLRYVGTYPDQMLALFGVGYDQEETTRAFRYLGRGRGNRYLPAECDDRCSVAYARSGFVRKEPRCEKCEPFARFIAEEDAEWQRTSPGARPAPDVLLSGNGGPSVVLDRKLMALWNGEAWVRSAAPWCSASADQSVRLSNGASLVEASTCNEISDLLRNPPSIFWISIQGDIHPIDLRPIADQVHAEVRYETAVELNREVWLVVETEASTLLLAPMTPSEVTRP